MKSKGYDISLIRRYLNGELDARAMYRLERQAQDDPMLMDLIMGMESGDENEHRQAIRELDELIAHRSAGRKSRVMPLVRWTVAASVLILSGLTAWFVFRKEPSAVKTAVRVERRAPVKTMPEPLSAPSDTVKTLPPAEEQVKTAVLQRKKHLKPKEIGEQIPETVRGEQRIAMLDKHAGSDSVNLNEVVVVGYGARKKTSITGSVSSIALPETSAVQALEGRVPGLSTSRVMIRGTSGVMFVSGVVMDKEDHSVMPGVAVTVAGTSSSSVTDREGRFRLAVPRSGGTLELKYIGYGSTFVNVRKDDTLTVMMEPSKLALNEVVITGYGRTPGAEQNVSAVETVETQPATGWRAFYAYLKKNAVVEKAKEGTVSLSFDISGSGRPVNFKIIKSDRPELNEEAIRLIREGPVWTRPEKNVRLKVRFRENDD